MTSLPSPAAPLHLHWDAEALWERLAPALPGLTVEVVARTESTNTRLLERARRAGGRADPPPSRPGALDPASTGWGTLDPVTMPGALDAAPLPGRAGDAAGRGGRRLVDHQPCLLVAEHQTRGRGRQGREWLGSPGASLTFSLALSLQPADWSGLSLAVGLALADALDPLPPGAVPRVMLKWPNDLWLRDPAAPGGGRKLGGILVETIQVGVQRMAVVGVGLNVLPQALAGLASGYACLQEIDASVTAPAALHRVAEPLVRALLQFERTGFDASGAADFARRDLLAGRAVTTTQPDCPAGHADGVDARGALRVMTPEGLRLLVSGEVSVRAADASA
jgi:BirA family biotin operon repressor/biotin-[acetyl-CoA-carboxylase] ligase